MSGTNQRPTPLRQIETERLRLRPHHLEDVDDVYTFAADPEWARFLPVPQPYRRQDAEHFLATQILLDPDQHLAWAIEIDARVVGGINLRLFHEQGLGEMGYSLARSHWGRGLMTEAVSAVIDHAFGHYDSLMRIRAMADARNLASLRVMAKAGMKQEGVLRKNRPFRGEWVDETWCGILRSEWNSAS